MGYCAPGHRVPAGVSWLRISADMYPFILSGNVLLAVLLIALWQREAKPDTGTKPNQ